MFAPRRLSILPLRQLPYSRHPAPRSVGNAGAYPRTVQPVNGLREKQMVYEIRRIGPGSASIRI